MDETFTTVPEWTPDQSVKEYVRQNPFKVSPWLIRDFFGNAQNVTEQQLDYSLDVLEKSEPRFTEQNKELLQELEKWALMVVPMIREIPLSVLLQVIEEFQKSPKILPLLPGYPKTPATKILDYIFPDNSLSGEEKSLQYKEVAKNTNRLLKYVRSWRENVASYIEGLETFLDDYEELSDEQKSQVENLMGRSKRLIPQIDKRIKTMLQEKEGAAEREEFERFYKAVVRDDKYKDMEPDVAKSQIQVIYDESDHVVRTIVAGTAFDIAKVKEEPPEEEESMEQQEPFLDDLSVSPNHFTSNRSSSKSQSPAKRLRIEEYSNQHHQHQQHPHHDAKVSDSKSDD